MLAKNPNDRPASALDFARELRAAAFTAAGSDPSLPTAAMAPIARRRMRSIAVGAAAAIVGGVAACFGALSLLASDGHPPVRPAIAAAPPPANAPMRQPAPDPGAGSAVADSPAPPANATVVVEIESTPHGAEVFRLPSETRVGVTPWRMEVQREEGTQTFLIRKLGFGERRVVIDLRTGGTRAVQLPHLPYRPPPQDSSRAEPARKEGEPVDPFLKVKVVK
jgi:hypothetical protein